MHGVVISWSTKIGKASCNRERPRVAVSNPDFLHGHLNCRGKAGIDIEEINVFE